LISRVNFQSFFDFGNCKQSVNTLCLIVPSIFYLESCNFLTAIYTVELQAQLKLSMVQTVTSFNCILHILNHTLLKLKQ